MSTWPRRAIASCVTRTISLGWLRSAAIQIASMSLRLQVRRRFLEVAGLARGQQHARAGLAERLGDLQAEAARAAGDERGLACEVEQLSDGGAHGRCLLGSELAVSARQGSGMRERTQTSTQPTAIADRAGDDDAPAVATRAVAAQRDAEADARTGRRRSAPRSACRCAASRRSKRLLGHRAAGVVARCDDAEPGADARQLVVEEVAAGGEPAALRVARPPRAAAQVATSSQIQASDDVAERLQVRRRVGERLVGDAGRPGGARRRGDVRRRRGAAPARARRAPRSARRARSSRRSPRAAASRPAPPSITTLRPSRSSAWMPCVPSWIMLRRLSRQYCSTGKSRV